MKTLLSAAFVVFFISCDNCPGEDEECPYGTWNDSACECSCENNTCDHGVWDDPNCECDCYDNWSGAHCNVFLPSLNFHADISINNTNSYVFNPSLDLEIIDSEVDTIRIDGYFDGNPGFEDDRYVYLNLVVNDLNDIIDGDSYPIDASYQPGTCWASYHDPLETGPNYFNAGGSTAGYLTITSLILNYNNTGQNFVSGNFEFTLSDFAGSSAEIIGYFDGAD